MEGSVGVVALVGTLFDQTSCKIIRVAFLMPFFDAYQILWKTSDHTNQPTAAWTIINIMNPD